MRADKVCPSVPCLESLEPRVLLAGNVIAFTAAGNLYLFGDTADNDVVVTDPAPNTLRLASGADATTINGGAGPVDFTVTGDVWAFPGLGNDTLTVDDCALPRDLWFFGSLGNNTLLVNNPSGDPSLRDLWVFNSVGNDNVTLTQAAVTRNVFIDTSLGANTTRVDSSSTIGGNMTVLGAGNDNNVILQSSTLTGNLVVSYGFGSAQVSLMSTGVQGNVTVLNVGGWVHTYVPGFSTLFGMSASGINGSLTVLNSLGRHEYIFANSAVGGNVFLSNGSSSAQFSATGTVFAGYLQFWRGDGGDLAGHPGFSSWFEMTGSTIIGNTTIFNGLGADALVANTATFNGTLSITDNLGGALFDATDATFTGNVSMSSLNAVGTLPFGYGYLASNIEVDPTTFGGNASFSLGAGDDFIAFDAATVSGNLSINTGPGAATLDMTDCSLQGAFSYTRGDGGSLASPSGFSGAVEIEETAVEGPMTLNAGWGNDRITLRDISASDNVAVNTGMGNAEFTIQDASHVSGTMTLAMSLSGAVTAQIGAAAGGAVSFGALAVTTGGSADAVTVRNANVTNALTINTGSGQDAIAIDDVGLFGAVALTSGADWSYNDADTVNIERVAGSSMAPTFGAAWTVTTGAANDVVRIGLNGDANAHAAFNAAFQLNGGLGTDTFDYLTGGNTFGVAPVITSVETVT